MLVMLLLGSLALQAWTWPRLRRRVIAGEMTRLGGAVRYGGWAAAPLVFFVGAFLGLVGLEELSGRALIPEAVARAALPLAVLLFGIFVLGWLGFSVSCARIGPGAKG